MDISIISPDTIPEIVYDIIPVLVLLYVDGEPYANNCNCFWYIFAFIMLLYNW